MMSSRLLYYQTKKHLRRVEYNKERGTTDGVAEHEPSEFPETDCSEGPKEVEREGGCKGRRGRVLE